MSQQLDLLGLPLGDDAFTRRIGATLPQPRETRRRVLHDVLADVPRAANADPETSHLAAERIKSSGALGVQQEHARMLVQQHPGSTSAELADMASRRGDGEYARLRSQLGRRLADLKGEHVRQGDARLCRKTGAKCVTWWPV